MYVSDKPEPIMLSVLSIIPYPKFIPIILNLFPSYHLMPLYLYYSLNFNVSAHSYIVADKFV